jgi:hypothetical protein
MKDSGLNDQQIYESLRETYGSLRLKKNLIVTDHTVRGLALIKLSNTLESNRAIYPTPKCFPISSISEQESQTPLHAQGQGQGQRQIGTPASLTPSQSPTRSSSQQSSSQKSTSEMIVSTGTGTGTPRTALVLTPATASASGGIRKKPNLKIQISGDQHDPADDAASVAASSTHASARASSRGGVGMSQDLNDQCSSQKTPRDRARISPSGALHVGELAICENGIQTSGYFAERQAIGFLTSGRSDFVIIGSLGRGASGSVLEALHLPTLTLVALKLLPVSNAENLHQIASELEVLYRNLAELKLIDQRLEGHDCHFMGGSSDTVDGTATVGSQGSMAVKSLCPQLLAMYDGRSQL